MRDVLNHPVINVLAAVTGGILLGFGVGRLAHTPTISAGIMAVSGVLLLWWSLVDRRKAKRGAPESERDGSHTIE